MPYPGRTAAATCRSTLSFTRWRQTAEAAPSASFSPEPHPMEPSDCRRSRPPGGITFAQDVQTARYDSMPRSAIATGVVDFVLAPAEIARQLATIGRNSELQVEPPDALEPAEESGLARILRLVRSATGVDFTHYKRGTLERRIKRRMALRGFEKLEDYSRDLEQNRQEATALCESCFITVTAFFREPAVFEELRKKVFPALLENRAPEDPIRIWVAGCASGEEAYSIAICLREFLDEADAEPFRSRFSPPISAKLRSNRLEPGSTRAPRWREFHPSGWRASSPGRNADTRLRRSFATVASSPATTWRRTRPSPGWTSSAVVTY